MKKKLSILPIVVLALTMLFGTVCVWADPINAVEEVKITMPTSCEGKKAGVFLSEINVSVKTRDGGYSNHLSSLSYDKMSGSYFKRTSPSSYELNPDDGMINGKYTISLFVASDPLNYYYFDPNETSITLNNGSIDDVDIRTPGIGNDAIRIVFDYTFGATPQAASTEKEAVAIIDRDLFKSEAPSKTAIVADSIGAKSFFDMKIHAADAQTQANQKLLAQNLVGANTKIFVTENIYPRRDLSISENGSLKVLNWNNLPKNQPGAISAVVYNQIDGAYTIHGILDANGTATFTGFKLRPASTITICK